MREGQKSDTVVVLQEADCLQVGIEIDLSSFSTESLRNFIPFYFHFFAVSHRHEIVAVKARVSETTSSFVLVGVRECVQVV
jgi:hypothetical protein